MGILTKRRISRVLAAGLALTICATAAHAETEGTAALTQEKKTAVRYMDTLPGCWSPLSEQTPEKEFILALTTDRLYRVEDGEVVPGLAADMPLDVTADYAGNETYGVPAGAARGYAFQIELEPNTYWQDGTTIKSGDLCFALEQMLENGGGNWIANAEGYLSGREREAETVISLKGAGFDSVAAAKEAGFTRFYVDMEGYWGLDAGWTSVTDRTRVRDYAMPEGLEELYVSGAYLYQRYLAEGADYAYQQAEFIGVSQTPDDKLTLEDVGIVNTGTWQVTIITEEPTTATALAVKLGDLILLRQDLFDDSYGTSAETYSSYGPYKLVSAGTQQIVLERNGYWQGDTSGYEADVIICRRQS